MARWDIDTYIATFEWLTLVAGWALNAEGTIVQFREGLSKGIHSKALDRDKIPCTMDEWKAVACTKVSRAKEKYNAGLTGAQCHNQQTHHYNVPQNQQQTSNQSNSNLSWLCRRNGLLFFFIIFSYLLFSPLFPFHLVPLCWFWTLPCLPIYADSYCTILTHPRILVLGPGGCTMTHGLIPWLTLFTLVCYRLRILNYKYPVVAVVGP